MSAMAAHASPSDFQIGIVKILFSMLNITLLGQQRKGVLMEC
jgi:hypothetical protein